MEGFEPVGGEGEACRHRVPAAARHHPRLARRDHRRAEIKARKRAARALDHPLDMGAHAGRAVEALLEAACHDPHHAHVPAGLGDQKHGAAGALLALGLRHRRFEKPLLDVLALAVELVEMAGDAGRRVGVAAAEQAEAEIGAPDAASGIDAGPEREAERVHIEAADAGGLDQRRQPPPPPLRQHLEPLGDEGAVEADERHHVGHGGERDEVEIGAEVGLGAGGEEAPLAQGAQKPDRGEESDAGGAEMPLARAIIGAVRVDRGEHRGQRALVLVVVKDDDVGLLG